MIKTLAAALIALSLTATGAAALTVTNNTSKEHKIGIDMGTKEKVETIAAGKSVKVQGCDEACGLTGPWGYSRMVKTGEDFAFDDDGIVSSGT